MNVLLWRTSARKGWWVVNQDNWYAGDTGRDWYCQQRWLLQWLGVEAGCDRLEANADRMAVMCAFECGGPVQTRQQQLSWV